jgi:flavodoxin
MTGLLKKIGAFLLSVFLVFSLAGCGSPADTNGRSEEDLSVNVQENVPEAPTTADGPEAETNAEQASDAVMSDETTGGNDMLVIYFSRTGEQYSVGVIDKGNTAIVAEMIAEQTGADTFEILPEEDYYPYTYDDLTDVAKKELNENARPPYAGEVPDLSKYGTIFIGAPVWWGDWPMICYTFFEENAEALSGKTLIPFCTHEGSGLSGFDRKLSSVCPNATVGEGLAIRGNDAQNNQDSVKDKVDEWLSGLGY